MIYRLVEWWVFFQSHCKNRKRRVWRRWSVLQVWYVDVIWFNSMGRWRSKTRKPIRYGTLSAYALHIPRQPFADFFTGRNSVLIWCSRLFFSSNGGDDFNSTDLWMNRLSAVKLWVKTLHPRTCYPFRPFPCIEPIETIFPFWIQIHFGM
jgi:hypothetical protein